MEQLTKAGTELSKPGWFGCFVNIFPETSVKEKGLMGFENRIHGIFLAFFLGGIFWRRCLWKPPGFQPKQLQQAGFHLKEMMMAGHCYPEVLVDGSFPVEQVAPTVSYFFSPLGATSDVETKGRGDWDKLLGSKKWQTEARKEYSKMRSFFNESKGT